MKDRDDLINLTKGDKPLGYIEAELTKVQELDKDPKEKAKV